MNDRRDRANSKFQTLMQKADQSVNLFYCELLKAAREKRTDTTVAPDDYECKMRFISGVSKPLRDHFVLFRPASLQDALDTAKRLEPVLLGKKNGEKFTDTIATVKPAVDMDSKIQQLEEQLAELKSEGGEVAYSERGRGRGKNPRGKNDKPKNQTQNRGSWNNRGNSNNRGRGRGWNNNNGQNWNQTWNGQQNNNSQQNYSGWNGNNSGGSRKGRGRGGSQRNNAGYNQQQGYCTYCNIPGHIIDDCLQNSFRVQSEYASSKRGKGTNKRLIRVVEIDDDSSDIGQPIYSQKALPHCSIDYDSDSSQASKHSTRKTIAVIEEDGNKFEVCTASCSTKSDHCVIDYKGQKLDPKRRVPRALINTTINRIPAKTLIDSGAVGTLIRPHFFNQPGKAPIPLMPPSVKLHAVNHTPVKLLGSAYVTVKKPASSA